MQKTENISFCTECGNQNNKINSFCLNCGNELPQEKLEYINTNVSKSSNTKSISTVNVKRDILDTSSDYINTYEMNMFISKNKEYYNKKFEQIIKTGNKKTWNWAAFFFNASWLLYRKMYIQSIILILVSLALGAITSTIPFLGTIIGWAMSLGMGMYANSIYLDHINKKLNEINTMEGELKESLILKKGGTNILLPLALVGIYLLLGVVIVVFFGALLESVL